MKIIVKVNRTRYFPNTEYITEFMWDKGISFSKAGDPYKFKKCTSICLSWDKWIDDIRWKDHPKNREYIYFEMPRNKDKILKQIIIEIDDNALFVDKRAFYKAGQIIASKTNGKISFDGSNWLTLEEFLCDKNEYLSKSFQEANDNSLL